MDYHQLSDNVIRRLDIVIIFKQVKISQLFLTAFQDTGIQRVFNRLQELIL